AYLGWAIIPIFLKSQYEKRCDQFVIQMVDALTIMANGVKSGSSPLQSMQRLVENMSNPISKEFQIVISQHQFGQSLEDSLNDLAKRIPRPDVEMFVTAINILKETGGNMSETFQTIVVTIRERQKVEMKIEAMIRQRLLTGYILTSIPFLVGFILYVMFPNLMMPMFNQPMGLVLLGVVIVMTIIGGIWIKKIVTIKV
ncbi:MAG: type II secretion system F family protein, partial [Pseudobdellovibrionaceae bacterium]